MKNFKKIASAIAALSLAACVAVPMSATVFTASAAKAETGGNTVTVTAKDDATHEYEAFQVFSGTYDAGTETLTNIDWGDGVDGTTLLAALKSDGTLGTYFNVETCKTASDVAKILSETETSTEEKTKVFSQDNDLMQKFADIVAANLKKDTAKQTSGDASGNTISKLPDGYYLIQDSKAPEKAEDGENSGAKTRFILKAVGGTTVSVDAKHAAPTVDKQVLDNDNADNTTIEGQKKATANETDLGTTGGTWGETADHAIGETFQFKLTAKLPESDEMEKYDAYQLVFNDTIGDGVDFNAPLNMKLYLNDGTTKVMDISEKSGDGSDQTAYYEKDSGGKKITITIPDVKQLSGVSKLSGTTVSVVYDAHLNTSADVLKKTGSTTNNKNTVSLDYSNNPNVSGLGDWKDDHGSTPEDTVWVFTYEVDNKKTAGDTGEPLPNAKFKLYKGDKTTVGDGSSATALNFTNVGGTYTFASTGGSNEIVSADKSGVFNFKGLDAGTYTLIETDAPAGYNVADPIEIVITAVHAETDSGNNATLTITQNAEQLKDSTTNDPYIEIVDNKGAVLPSTGGIGTTLFYLGGGALVAVAGVMLITKKRMTKE